VRGLEPDSADYVHLVVEATKLAFGDRDRWLADPEVVPVPTDRLLDPAYLHARAKTIRREAAAPGPVS
jgi:gamma-glutamyltranspeptidase